MFTDAQNSLWTQLYELFLNILREFYVPLLQFYINILKAWSSAYVPVFSVLLKFYSIDWCLNFNFKHKH